MTPSSTTQDQLDALRNTYIAHLDERVQELAARWNMLAAGDWSRENLTALHYQAHILAGSAATFGIHALGAVAQQLVEFLVALPAGATEVSAESRTTIEALIDRLAALARAGVDVVNTSPVPKALAARGRSERQTAVLLVEDDLVTADHLALQLEHFGYQTSIVHELAGLEKSINAQAPAAIILDIVFPEGDLAGPQRMATIQPDRDVPVIFLSQRSDFEARLWAVRAGGKAYLTKPTDIDTLVSALDTLTGAFVPEPYRVLIVDDTRLISTLYEATLRDAGMLTVALNDPAQIIRAIDEFQPDLLLLDMYMPNCTGTEVAALIRQQTAFVSLPIVFLSGEHGREQQLEALDRGGDDFLTKPITPAQLVSAVTSRARRARAMRAQLSRDGLTGLLTHASIKELAIREIVRAQRYDTALSIAMIDLDHFKQINDRYGHAAGDRVLKGLARLLHQRLRMSDSIGRYGGEEFLIILPQTTGPAALRLLDDVRARFAMIGHQLGDGEARVTFSGGVASLDSVGEGSHLLEAADLTLYAAKHAGRNQIQRFEQHRRVPQADRSVQASSHTTQDTLATIDLRGVWTLVITADRTDGPRITAWLRQQGGESDVADTKSAALSALMQAPPDLILLAVQLPDTTIGAMSTLIRAKAPEAAVVIICEHPAQAATWPEADADVRTPINLDELRLVMARMRRLLELRRQLSAAQGPR